MNVKVQALLECYVNDLVTSGVTVRNHSEATYFTSLEELEHVHWMLCEMLSPAEERLVSKFDDEVTLNRWLGFIQGVLYSNRYYTIAELRAQSSGLYKE